MKNDMERSEELEREVGDDRAAYEEHEDLMDLLDESWICPTCGEQLDVDGYCANCDVCESCGMDLAEDGSCYHCDYDEYGESLEDDDAPAVRRMRRDDD